MVVRGLILAGGAGKRLGGVDKAALTVGGQSLLDLVARRLAPQVAGLSLSTNADPARCAGFGGPVLGDPDLDQPQGTRLGPLAGLLAGLDWLDRVGGDYLATVAVDTPFFPDDMVAQLLRAAGGAGAPAVAESRGRLHPTCGLWPARLRDPLRATLVAGERRLGRWALAVGALRVAFPVVATDPFFNINTPEDLATAEAMVAR